jgi:hypothetical protein
MDSIVFLFAIRDLAERGISEDGMVVRFRSERSTEEDMVFLLAVFFFFFGFFLAKLSIKVQPTTSTKGEKLSSGGEFFFFHVFVHGWAEESSGLSRSKPRIITLHAFEPGEPLLWELALFVGESVCAKVDDRNTNTFKDLDTDEKLEEIQRVEKEDRCLDLVDNEHRQ